MRKISKRLINHLYLYEDNKEEGIYSGEQLVKLSNDYFTGSIGVITTLSRFKEIELGRGYNNHFYLDDQYNILGRYNNEK